MITFVLLVFVTIYLAVKVDRLEKKMYQLYDVNKSDLRQKPAENIVTSPENLTSKSEIIPEKVQNIPSVQSGARADQADRGENGQNLEFKFGGRIFTIIGIIAMLFGIGFFLKYAFENNLISESVRVILGMSAGIILLLVGIITRKKHETYGNILTGGAMGVWYLSIYSSFAFYSLIPIELAFVGMILVTAVGIFLSLLYNAQPIMYISQIGGFLTPILIGNSSQNHHALFLYIFMLNAGLIIISLRKSWRPLTLLNVVYTVIVSAIWYEHSYSIVLFNLFLAYSSLLFVTFLIVTIINQLKPEEKTRGIDLAILFVVPGIYYISNIFEIDRLYPDYTSVFTIILGVLYLILGFFVRNPQSKSKSIMNEMFLSVSLVFLSISIPLLFDANAITIGWSILALAIILLSFVINSVYARVFSYAIFALSLGRMFMIDMHVDVDKAWLNDRFIPFSLIFLFLLAVSYVYRYYAQTKTADELSLISSNEMSLGSSIMTSASYMVLAVGVSLEIIDFYDHMWLPIAWSLLLVVSSFASIWMRCGALMYTAGMTVLLIIPNIIFNYHKIVLSEHRIIFNERFLVSAIALAAVSLFVILVSSPSSILPDTEKKKFKSIYTLIMNLFALWLITVEIRDYFDSANAKDAKYDRGGTNMKRVAISIAWALYSIALLVIGIIKKTSGIRKFALLLMGVVIFKVFIYDTSNVGDVARFVSFLSLGAILLVAGFLYYRFKDKILEFINAENKV